MVMYPTYSQKVSLETIKRARNFTGMHPTMQDRIGRLLEKSGGRVGWGQGLRTDQQQLQLFLSRYEPDPGGKVSWDGKRWSRVRGAPASPPGRSMHGIGLAADLVGDFDWLGHHAAEFGLLTFADVNSEPWHVQPVELGKSRRSYESDGSTWGAHPNFVVDGTAVAGSTAAAGVSAVAAGPAPQGGSSSTPGPTLTPALVAKPGSDGAAARVVHEAMVARELLPDTPASRGRPYDASDEQIVRVFQGDKGLEADGWVGPQTWGALLKIVEPDAQGPIARTLQMTLIVRQIIRDNASNLDGIYGPATQSRVREFQQVSGLEVDGMVGPKSWTALLGVKRPVDVGRRGLDPEDPDDPAVRGDVVDLDDLDLLAILEGMSVT